MSHKHLQTRAKQPAGPSSLLKQTPIFVTCSNGYKALYSLFLQALRQVKLDEALVKPLLYDFPNFTPQTPNGWRTAPWYQAQRQKFAYFRDQLAQLPADRTAIFCDVDTQFFPALDALESVMESMRRRELELMILAEHGGPILNPGFILAHNTAGTRTFFERVSTILGDYGQPLHGQQTLVTEGEPEQVVNRVMQRTTAEELKWAIIPPEHVVFGTAIHAERWDKVFLHHAIFAAGTPAKMEQMGRVRHAYYNWKYAEATGFPSSQHADPLSHCPKVQGGLWIARDKGKLYTRDDGGIDTRNPSVIKLLDMVQQKFHDLPDFKAIYMCTNDTPQVRVPGMHVLAFNTDKRSPRTAYGQHIIAAPDNVFDHRRSVGINDYDETCAQMRAAGQRVPIKNVAGWIGNAHSHPGRLKLVEMAKAHPAEIEAVNTGVWKQAPNLPRLEVSQGRWVSLPEQAATWSYLLDVEGNGSSGRLKLLLFSGRPVLLQERAREEYYFSLLKPFEHYVPVAADMSDLVKQVQWLQANPDEGDRIARNAQNFAQQHLTRDAALTAWARVLRTLS